MMSLLARHRLVSVLEGAASVRLSAFAADYEAAIAHTMRRTHKRALLAGQSVEAARKSELADRLIGQLALVTLVASTMAATLLMVRYGAPEAAAVVAGAVPAALMVAVQLADRRLSRASND